jgi:hypothetical protein
MLLTTTARLGGFSTPGEEKMPQVLARTASVVAAAFITLSAHAFPIADPGTEGFLVIVSTTDDVVATYEGNSAAYSDDLFLQNTSTFVFNNHASAVGSTVNLGTFAAGTELLFRLHVNNTGYDYFTGPASRNPDQQIHARVEDNFAPNTTLVSFEDLFNGPFDYNDLSFSFSNTNNGSTTAPEPATLALLAASISGLAFRRRRKQNAA